MGSNSTRIIASILLFLGAFVLPWWFFTACAALLFFKFSPFYEGLAIGLAADLLYAVPREMFQGLPVFFICFFVIFLLCGITRRQLRIGN